MSDEARVGRPNGPGRRQASLLAYVALWIGAVVVLVVEREDRHIRFHAWQSLLALGGLWLLGLACWGVAFLALAFSGGAFRLLIWLGNVVWAVMVLVWIACVYNAAAGDRWQLPWVGRLAARWADADP